MSRRPESPLSIAEPELSLGDSRGISLRVERAGDVSFLEALYAGTRSDEMALVDWPADRKQAFLHQQFQAQRAHYREHYPQARFLIVLFEGRPIGRLYYASGREELRLMDIALLAAYRRCGHGRVLMRAVVGLALRDRLELSLHVEPFNPARDWYERLGFELVEERGVYLFMRLPADKLASAYEKLTS